MTPTEQDKELREKVATIVEYWDFSPLQDEDSRIERLKDEIMQLITADRKRVALEARLNEVQNAYECWINGRKFISSYFRDRIALLSNTKESK